MSSEHRNPRPEAAHPPQRQRDVQPIGHAGRPIRAMAFAGGGFDTALQLGVVHALLVSRSDPPDVVIGSSFGAVNAVALAEVFQAGRDPEARVARFRALYEAYRKAPGQIAYALKPDTFQIDTRRPLEPLQLPTQHQLERDWRLDAVTSRAGLVNLYNALLDVRISIGTLSRAVRRWLGVKAAGEIRQPVGRALARVVECFRSWALLGMNLHRAAPLLPLFVRAALGGARKRRESGATAGELIFHAPLWGAVWRRATWVASLATLALVWVFVAVLATGVVLALGFVILRIAQTLPGVSSGWTWEWTLLAGFLLGAAASAAGYAWIADPADRRNGLVAFWAITTFGLLTLAWAAALATLVAIPSIAYVVTVGVGDVRSASFARVTIPWLYWGIPVSLLVLAGALIVGLLIARRRILRIGLLALYDLDAAIFDQHALREILIRMVDPGYYGEENLPGAVEKALRDDRRPHDGERGEKLLDEYAVHRRNPIHVCVSVADAAAGGFEVLPGAYRVVDAVLAATAAVPLFPPVAGVRTTTPAASTTQPTRGEHSQQVERRLYIDGSSVMNEPTRPLFTYLRHSPLVNEKATALHVYSVVALPLSRDELGPEQDQRERELATAQPERRKVARSKEYTDLVDIVTRAMQLRRFRDATLERRLTHLHTRAMPRDWNQIFFNAGRKRFLRTWVFPIEPDQPLRLNRRLLMEEGEAVRQRLVGEAVADGCRAALESMIQPSIAVMAPLAQPTEERRAYCRKAIASRRGMDPGDARLGLAGSIDIGTLKPSEAESAGPGLVEVCRHCALGRRPDGTSEADRTLRLHTRVPREPPLPAWPMEGNAVDERWAPAPREKGSTTAVRILGWPQQRGGLGGGNRPLVSLLFSGGVFRGVFQVGVLNALSEVGLQPDIVAGASVGSIVAAMVARTFLTPPGLDSAAARALRQQCVQRVAAAFLAIDRLVLTDRFADFVRGLTVRAAQTRFSLRDVDRVLRRFDAAGPATFNREVRRVVAGIERLTYVSPFELQDLVEAFRRQQLPRALELLGVYFQDLLDRAGVGLEVLGAEPLERLIAEYVLKDLPRYDGTAPWRVPFNAFLDGGMYFLATATNLSKGRLEILGEEQLDEAGKDITILNSLLASSAFPGVFRPRWSWEFCPASTMHDQYIDGGVIDNLPLDAVVQVLNRAAAARLIAKRPAAPHLVFAASLEPETEAISAEPELDALRHDWPRLLRRSLRLGYNQKLDVFKRTQRNLRAIAEAREQMPQPPDPDVDWIPLDVEVVTVIPRWLCSTFAFHPMLGFRRRDQAASIAHGCASTLLTLGRHAHAPDTAPHVRVWGIDLNRLPTTQQVSLADAFVPVGTPEQVGNCWYRPAVSCPFSRQSQEAGGSSVYGMTVEELDRIYQVCRQRETHLPRRGDI